jgi:kinesin family protein 6/9
MRNISISTYVRLKPHIDDQKSRLQMNLSSLIGREEGSIEYEIQTIPISEQRSNFTSEVTEMTETRDLLNILVPDDLDPGLVIHSNTDGKLTYEFDKVFETDATQEDIFECVVRSRLEDVMHGINCTIFAYGQTGSGKTYTMSGGNTFQSRGIIPRTIGCLFNNIKSMTAVAADTNTVPPRHRIQISFTEVYNEVVYDLLDAKQRELPIQQRKPVQILESAEGLLLRNVNLYEVSAEAEALGLFFMGSSARIQDATTMNAVSSRSHAIFTLLLETTAMREGTLLTYTGKLNLVDLAGSERMYKMQNSVEQRKEAKR